MVSPAVSTPDAPVKLRYVKAYRDRWGRQRYYFRRKGSDTIPLPGGPGDPEFIATYEAATKQGAQWRARGGTVRGNIYIIRVRGFDLVKIGYSTDPDRRLEELAGGSGMGAGLEMLFRFRGRRVLERKIHAQFAEHRLFGEWFRLSGPVSEWLDRLMADKVEREIKLGDLGFRSTNG